MQKRTTLYGMKFGRLTAIEPVRVNGEKCFRWRCLCECGNEILAKSYKLKSGHTRSCGCLVSDTTTRMNKARAKPRNERLYRIYYGMMSRCNNKKYDAYKHYGARGIKVCPEWSESFYVFEKWAFSNGYDDRLTLDRINNDGNYEPSNCRWATMKVQSNNRHPAGWYETQKELLYGKEDQMYRQASG